MPSKASHSHPVMPNRLIGLWSPSPPKTSSVFSTQSDNVSRVLPKKEKNSSSWILRMLRPSHRSMSRIKICGHLVNTFSTATKVPEIKLKTSITIFVRIRSMIWFWLRSVAKWFSTQLWRAKISKFASYLTMARKCSILSSLVQLAPLCHSHLLSQSASVRSLAMGYQMEVLAWLSFWDKRQMSSGVFIPHRFRTMHRWDVLRSVS